MGDRDAAVAHHVRQKTAYHVLVNTGVPHRIHRHESLRRGSVPRHVDRCERRTDRSYPLAHSAMVFGKVAATDPAECGQVVTGVRVARPNRRRSFRWLAYCRQAKKDSGGRPGQMSIVSYAECERHRSVLEPQPVRCEIPFLRVNECRFADPQQLTTVGHTRQQRPRHATVVGVAQMDDGSTPVKKNFHLTTVRNQAHAHTLRDQMHANRPVAKIVDDAYHCGQPRPQPCADELDDLLHTSHIEAEFSRAKLVDPRRG